MHKTTLDVVAHMVEAIGRRLDSMGKSWRIKKGRKCGQRGRLRGGLYKTPSLLNEKNCTQSVRRCHGVVASYTKHWITYIQRGDIKKIEK
ncbi:hypothetical protein Scep_023996 [Stephania cephalantha]|uniref:Uncharacterized protein n=1 Tax=Stephania cephalantha TaxID=152367 RepID=A0AAP0EVQ5_9MAGN